SGNGWEKSVHPTDVESCRATYGSSFDARRSFQIEYRLRRYDGEYRWVLDRGVPRSSPDGLFSGYIGSCTDITDLKQAHDRLFASQKLESLGLMAAGVAHDFGNHLGTILAQTDLALSELAADAPCRENVQEIATVAMRASEIVEMLMASAGAGSGSDVLVPVDLSSEVERTLRLLKVSISKKVVVRTSLARNLPTVRGNVAQLHPVVVHLVTNAAEALANKQGSITVSTDLVHVSAAFDNRLFWLPDGDYVRLRVTDTGCGINAETRARIFDQFFTTKSLGRGLGLAAVHGIVRSHGGAINVESTAGVSATSRSPCP